MTLQTISGDTYFPDSKISFISSHKGLQEATIFLSSCHISNNLKPYFSDNILAWVHFPEPCIHVKTKIIKIR
jgi:hypothetical protein